MKTRSTLVVLAISVVMLAALLAIRSRLAREAGSGDLPSSSDGGDHPPGVARPSSPPAPSEPAPNAAALADGGVLASTVKDRAIRDDMRRRIFEAWAASTAPTANVAPARYAPMPHSADGGVDPDYIRARVREDFIPMARGCYEDLLARKPKAAGKMVVKFTIVGDEKVGGVVDEATIGDASTLADEQMATCFRESMMSMAFGPPPHGGKVTIDYPFDLSPDEDEEAGAPSSGR